MRTLHTLLLAVLIEFVTGTDEVTEIEVLGEAALHTAN